MTLLGGLLRRRAVQMCRECEGRGWVWYTPDIHAGFWDRGSGTDCEADGYMAVTSGVRRHSVPRRFADPTGRAVRWPGRTPIKCLACRGKGTIRARRGQT